MLRHGVLFRYNHRGVVLHRMVGPFDYHHLNQKKSNFSSRDPPPSTSGSNNRSADGLRKLKSTLEPTYPHCNEEQGCSWSLWGQSDRIYDNQLRSHSGSPPSCESPFARIRKRQQQQQSSSSSTLSRQDQPHGGSSTDPECSSSSGKKVTSHPHPHNNTSDGCRSSAPPSSSLPDASTKRSGATPTSLPLSSASSVSASSRKGNPRHHRPSSSSSSSPSSSSSSSSSPTPTHLYANKENAWEHYTDDRYYGARRFKEYYLRMAKDRAVRYYFLGILVLLVGAWAKLYQLEQEQRATEGLLGPKKKKYRSRLTVVLDVDETIVSFGDKAYRMKAGLVARPYLAELLDYLSSIDAEVVLWCACSERYMRQVLQVIDPSGIRISHYVTKDKSWFSSDNFYEKNLLWLKRDLKDILFVENRALSVRNCNANSILVDDFIRGEYMDSGQDHPSNDRAMRVVKEVVEALETTGMGVPEYLSNVSHRHPEVKEIPCHHAIRQLPEELARGVFFFIGDKYRPQSEGSSSVTLSSSTGTQVHGGGGSGSGVRK